jgi:hypothetical protein
MRWPSVEALRPGKSRAIQSSKKNKAVSVIASTRRDVCLHAEVPADAETLPGGRRYSTQAWQSDTKCHSDPVFNTGEESDGDPSGVALRMTASQSVSSLCSG